MRWMVFLMYGALAAAAQDVDRVAERFFNDYQFHFQPSSATSAGFHEFDHRLEDYSAPEIAARAATLRRFEREFAALAPGPDRDLMLGHVRGKLLDLEQIRMWQRNPDFYSSAMAESAFTIMSRTFAPAETRLHALIAREAAMPRLLEQGRANLRNPPKVYVEIALDQLPGIISFFEKDVPAAFAGVNDPSLVTQFQKTTAGVIAALRGYQEFLKTGLLPRANGDFRIGAELYRKKLAYNEMVDTPLDRLLAIGYADLRKNQAAFRAVARQIDPAKTAEQVMADVEKDHPAPDRILDEFRSTFSGLRDFIETHRIVTIPSPVLPTLEETPPFMRALTSASMDTPGPFEAVAKEAFFNVTLPAPGLSAKELEEFMGSLSRGTILSTAIHEAYPGHYVQFLWVQRAPSKIRKLVGADSNAEGWAHYSEQMMLDEGLTSDPKMRLGQLRDALLRDARFLCGIQMHTGKMTMEDARAFFVKEGFQTRPTAAQETRRGTSDPTYLVYTLGKLQILKLREDYRKKMGAKFSLGEFHDRFLAEGYPPVRIVRRALLGDDSPVL